MWLLYTSWDPFLSPPPPGNGLVRPHHDLHFLRMLQMNDSEATRQLLPFRCDGPLRLINVSSGLMSQCADCSSFKDPEAIRQLAAKTDMLTVEIEHVDCTTLDELEANGKSTLYFWFRSFHM